MIGPKYLLHLNPFIFAPTNHSYNLLKNKQVGCAYRAEEANLSEKFHKDTEEYSVGS